MNIISFTKHTAKVILGRENISFIPKTNNEYDSSKCFYENINESKIISNNSKQYKHLVAIDGVGFSGSSAVGDFLGEFSNCTSLGGVELQENPDRGQENAYEIDFLREPGGLIDLERICSINTPRIRDNAVHQFIDVCNKYRYSGIPIYDDYFFEKSKEFVKNIMSYAFNDSPSHVSYHPKKLTKEVYRNFAKDYMLSVLKNIPSKDFLICDNLASVGRPDFGIVNDYLDNCKVIYNFSDPRDIYARARLEPGNDWVPINPEIFVQNWKENVIPALNDKGSNVLYTNFDDFCNDYETQAKKIMDFIGLEEKDHTQKFKFFNPKV